jgi:hypothetical protein
MHQRTRRSPSAQISKEKLVTYLDRLVYKIFFPSGLPHRWPVRSEVGVLVTSHYQAENDDSIQVQQRIIRVACQGRRKW